MQKHQKKTGPLQASECLIFLKILNTNFWAVQTNLYQSSPWSYSIAASNWKRIKLQTLLRPLLALILEYSCLRLSVGVTAQFIEFRCIALNFQCAAKFDLEWTQSSFNVTETL